jgi:Protein of unknown function (DUF4197)
MMKFIKFFLIVFLPLHFGGANAGFLDDIKGALGTDQGKSSSSIGSALLSNQEVAGGLKEALGNGAQVAVAELGKTDGFFSNTEVKIPIPKKLRKVEKGLRAVGKDELADEFILSMNRAAEQAVPMAADVFRDVVSNMTIEDAMGILKGGDNAGTDYLRKTSSDALQARFRPIVETAIQEVDATRSYQEFVGNSSMLGGLLGGKGSSLNLTDYVTDKALDGVFHMIGQEEARIRKDPVARTSDLLKKVFGSVD